MRLVYREIEAPDLTAFGETGFYKTFTPKIDSRSLDISKIFGSLKEVENKSSDDFDFEHYSKKNNNIKALKCFENLPDGWNDYGAKSFSKALIEKCIDLINSPGLKYQPDIFPTGRDSIQFEYEAPDRRYLEIEIYTDRIAYYYESIDGKEMSSEFATWEEALDLINDYHTAARNRR